MRNGNVWYTIRMRIIYTPAPILLKQSKLVDKIDAGVIQILKDMAEALKKSDIGIGLAAPQIGILLKIFLAAPNLQNKKNKNTAKIQTFINPVMLSASKPEKKPDDKTLEGCLSIPHIWGPVARSNRIMLEYMDGTGKKQVKTFTGAMAVIIQHEVDHLNGILFTQRVIEQGRKLYQVDKETGELERVEI